MFGINVLNSIISQVFYKFHILLSGTYGTKIDQLTEKLRPDGYPVAKEPPTTGDGYYESVIPDPENKIIEIVA